MLRSIPGLINLATTCRPREQGTLLQRGLSRLQLQAWPDVNIKKYRFKTLRLRPRESSCVVRRPTKRRRYWDPISVFYFTPDEGTNCSNTEFYCLPKQIVYLSYEGQYTCGRTPTWHPLRCTPNTLSNMLTTAHLPVEEVLIQQL